MTWATIKVVTFPQQESDRLLLGIRPFYPKDAIFACLRVQLITEGRKGACSLDQLQHIKEVADVIRGLVQRAKSGDLRGGENHILFFAFKSNNKHVVRAKEDCKKGRWTSVSEHRPRGKTVGNGTAKSPRQILFGNETLIERAPFQCGEGGDLRLSRG